jgi:hypothetical protein
MGQWVSSVRRQMTDERSQRKYEFGGGVGVALSFLLTGVASAKRVAFSYLSLP